MESRRLAMESRRLAMESRRLAMEARRPAMKARRPAMEARRPAMEAGRLAMEAGRPAMHPLRPVTHAHRSPIRARASSDRRQRRGSSRPASIIHEQEPRRRELELRASLPERHGLHAHAAADRNVPSPHGSRPLPPWHYSARQHENDNRPRPSSQGPRHDLIRGRPWSTISTRSRRFV